MAEQESSLERETSLLVSRVVATVAGKFEPAWPLPDHIEIKQATPNEWTFRFYFGRAGEYEGGVIQLDS